MTTTTQRRILMLDPTSEADLAFVHDLLPKTGFDVSAPAPETTVTPEMLRDAEIVVTRSQPVDAALIAATPNLTLIQKYGGRADRIDLDATQAANIPVALMPLCGCIAVAELAMTLVLALSKELVHAHTVTADASYQSLGIEPKLTSQRVIAFQWMKLQRLQEIRRKTLGIVGFGEIGTEIAKRARAFEMDVVYFKRDPLPTAMEKSLGVRSAPLDDLLAQSDFVSINVPHSDATHRLIGARELALMKPTAYLVNTCRGPVVDEAALIAALQSGSIAGAGLDVFDYEPLPHDNPLLQLAQTHNVILTPHIGGGTGGAREKQMRDVLDNVVRFTRGEPVLNLIT